MHHFKEFSMLLVRRNYRNLKNKQRSLKCEIMSQKIQSPISNLVSAGICEMWASEASERLYCRQAWARDMTGTAVRTAGWSQATFPSQ